MSTIEGWQPWVLQEALKLASLFGDHAMLQRGKAIPVWGTATPLGRIECRLGRLVAATVAADDGRFMVRFPAQPAGGPFDLQVRDADNLHPMTPVCPPHRSARNKRRLLQNSGYRFKANPSRERSDRRERK